MHSTLPKASKANLSFKEGILSVQFIENSLIEVEDIIYIYCYGMEKSNRKPYGILFDSSTNHELSEEAVIYLGDSDLIKNVIAIAYISKNLLSKIRLSLLLIFEQPPIKPRLFTQEAEARQWLEQQVNLFRGRQ